MSAPSQSDAGGEAGRVRCLYCGANNFPSSAACWQCSRPLKAVRAATSAEAPAAQAALPPLSVSANVRPVSGDDSGVSPLAVKTAAALGMLFPYVGLPAGMIFLMLDDPRKTRLGWLLIGWSIAGTLISVLSLAATLGPLWALLRGMLPHPGGGAAPIAPSLPDMSGGDGFIIPQLYLRLNLNLRLNLILQILLPGRHV